MKYKEGDWVMITKVLFNEDKSKIEKKHANEKLIGQVLQVTDTENDRVYLAFNNDADPEPFFNEEIRLATKQEVKIYQQSLIEKEI